MSWNERRLQGEYFEKYIFSLLENHEKIISVIRNGTEHTHPTFVDLLRINTTAGSLFVRHAPDGVFLDDKDDVHYYECKASMCIEKESYETCMQYHSLGLDLILYCWDAYTDNSVYCQSIENIKFRYYDWKYPRESGEKYNGSGTPYNIIITDGLKHICQLTKPDKF
jgi:hypothetical protein